jgi:Rha family phage regulatory protein
MTNNTTAIPAIPQVTVINGTIKTTSLDIAKTFNKRHTNVLRAIENLDCSAHFATAHFCAVVRKVKAGIHYREEKYYEITRDGFAFLCMGFTGAKAAQFKEAYINAFNAMEAKLTTNYLNTRHGQHAPAGLFSGLDNGRYLLVATKGEVILRDIAGCNIVKADSVRKIQQDLRTLADANLAMQQRLSVLTGDQSSKLLDAPLNIGIGWEQC